LLHSYFLKEIRNNFIKDKFLGVLVKFIRSVNRVGETKKLDATRKLQKFDNPHLRKSPGRRITVYSAKIELVEKKSYEYEQKLIEYYLITLKDIEFG